MVELKNENKQNRRQRFRNDNVTIVWKIWKIFSWTSGHFGAFFSQKTNKFLCMKIQNFLGSPSGQKR